MNPHAHSLLPDGLFAAPPASASNADPDRTVPPPVPPLPLPNDPPPGADPLVFYPLPPPTQGEIQALTARIARRLRKVARRHLGDDDEALGNFDESDFVLHQAQADALQAPVRLPPPPPGTSLAFAAPPPPPQPLCAAQAGFSLHAATVVDPDDRDRLERLCRYGLRPPFAQKRLSVLPDGRVRYELRRPWPTTGGATALILEPLAFLSRLATLVPAPYTNLIRYHGVFANRSRFRQRLPPPPPRALPSPCPVAAVANPTAAATDTTQAFSATAPAQAACAPVAPAPAAPASPTPAPSAGPRPARPRRLAWATLLRRVLHVEALRCPKCSAALVVLAFISDVRIVRKILTHLKLPADPLPLAPARAPAVLELFDDEFAQDREPGVAPSASPTARHQARGPP